MIYILQRENAWPGGEEHGRSSQVNAVHALTELLRCEIGGNRNVLFIIYQFSGYTSFLCFLKYENKCCHQIGWYGYVVSLAFLSNYI